MMQAQIKLANLALSILIASAIVTDHAASLQVNVQAASNNHTANSAQPQRHTDLLQAHLNQIQQQVHRQLSQFNGLVMNAANANATNRQTSNVLDALSTVGKVIHQQISAATNPNHVNIVSGSGGLNLAQSGNSPQESANIRKNQYQSVQPTETNSGAASPAAINTAAGINPVSNANYREQVEVLRQEITRRAGQLQQVVAGSMDLLKNNGDLIMRNLLAQMNNRLDQAKAKADRIISSEPLAMNEMTVRTLNTINSGLNNLNTIIANIVARIDSANKVDQQRLNQVPSLTPLQQRVQQTSATGAGDQMAANLPQLLDTSRIRTNLQQLGQQFAQAINGTSLQQQLNLLRSQRLQQQASATPSTTAENIGSTQAK